MLKKSILLTTILTMTICTFLCFYLLESNNEVQYGMYQTSKSELPLDTPMLQLLEDSSFNLSERGISDSTIIRGEYKLKDNHIILTPSNNDDKYYFTVGRKRLIYKADISADLGIKNNTPFYFNGEFMKTQA